MKLVTMIGVIFNWESILNNTNYTPNISDPRIRSRLLRAQGFARGLLHPYKPRQIAQVLLNKYMGQGQHDLGEWLRGELLTCTNEYWDMYGGRCKEYTLNLSGWLRVRDLLKLPLATDQEIVNEWANKEFATEFSDEFVYTDKSDRLWHPLQNVRTSVRRELFAAEGMGWVYDIECCAPTLIHQYSKQLGNKEWQPRINEYLMDRTAVREWLGEELGITTGTAKVLLTAIFAGAPIGCNKLWAVYNLLDCDRARINWLQENFWIKEFIAEVRACWNYIKPVMGRRAKIMPNNKQRMLAIQPRDKWAVYFRLERRIINEVRLYLLARNNRHFLEHDGWTTEQPVDLTELTAHIKLVTDFEVQITEKFYYKGEKDLTITTPIVSQVSCLAELSDFQIGNLVSSMIIPGEISPNRPAHISATLIDPLPGYAYTLETGVKGYVSKD